ncbi:MAG: exosortase/archaeosortase family protein [Candidatus Heimdallarchaeota archaeon]
MVIRRFVTPIGIILWVILGMNLSFMPPLGQSLSQLTSILIYLVIQILIPTWFILSSVSLLLWLNYGRKENLLFLWGVGTSLLLFLVFAFSQIDVTMVGLTTLRLNGYGKYIQVMIISPCSGIYGLLLFTSTYLIMIQETNSKWILRRAQLVILAVLGALGAYLVNLIRILILIVVLVHFSQLLEFIHLLLGVVLFIAYIVGYWTTLWTHLSKVDQIKKNIQKIG